MNLRPWCPFAGKAVVDDDRRGRIGETTLDVVEAENLRDRRNVQRPIAERDARGFAQSRSDHLDARLACSPRRAGSVTA